MAEPEAELGGILVISVQLRGNNALVSCILRVNILTGNYTTYIYMNALNIHTYTRIYTTCMRDMHTHMHILLVPHLLREKILSGNCNKREGMSASPSHAPIPTGHRPPHCTYSYHTLLPYMTHSMLHNTSTQLPALPI